MPKFDDQSVMEYLGWTCFRCIGNCGRKLLAENPPTVMTDGWYICRRCFKDLKLTLDDIPAFVPHEDQLRHESDTVWREERSR